MDEHYKFIDAYLPVEHKIFLSQAPEVNVDEQNPHYNGNNHLAQQFLAITANIIRCKSSLVLAEIYSFGKNAVKFAPLSGAPWTPLPKFIQNNKAIINAQNEYERCFAYAIASALLLFTEIITLIIHKRTYNILWRTI